MINLTMMRNEILFNELQSQAEALETNSLNYEFFGTYSDTDEHYEINLSIRSDDPKLLINLIATLQEEHQRLISESIG